MAYYNPDGVVEKEKTRTVIVRFKTKEDMIAFSKKTGIVLNKSIKTVEYPINNTMNDLFSGEE